MLKIEYIKVIVKLSNIMYLIQTGGLIGPVHLMLKKNHVIINQHYAMCASYTQICPQYLYKASHKGSVATEVIKHFSLLKMAEKGKNRDKSIFISISPCFSNSYFSVIFKLHSADLSFLKKIYRNIGIDIPVDQTSSPSSFKVRSLSSCVFV